MFGGIVWVGNIWGDCSGEMSQETSEEECQDLHTGLQVSTCSCYDLQQSG